MPTIPEALAIAIQHHRGGRLEAAEQIYRQILLADPTLPEVHNNLGLALKLQGKLGEAVACYRSAVALKPEFAEAHNNLGLALIELGMPGDAVKCCRRALELAPRLAVAQNNLGNALKELGSLEEAVASYRRALELKPDFAEAQNNLGVVSMVQGKIEEAVASYRRALELKPDYALARLNLATALLHRGRFDEAWPEHEARLALFPPRRFSAPRWNHEPAEGETILLHCEQGFGDTLQFVRYAGLVRERTKARRVILECQPPLSRLLRRSVEGGIEVIARGSGEGADSALPAVDWHLPLLSLPLALGISEPLSMSQPYLRADPELRGIWKARLARERGLRVGLAWRGSPTQARDRYRSMPAQSLRPLLEIAGASFYSLQLGAGRAEAAALGEAGLLDYTEQIGDFADTAALMCELDLIIAVDTAVVHLAGALGRPVWNLLTVVPHWPWGLKGEATPWYPTMRLFRQTEEGEWRGVVERVAAAFKNLPGRSPNP